jgi:hypothetical protein
MCLNNLSHELLFESGCLAFLRRSFRDAVSSFAAAEERAIELYLRVHAHDAGVPEDEIGSAWKHLKQSERQFGAFAWTFLLTEKRAHRSVSAEEAHRKLRNDVIHAGYFPTQIEAHAFGAAVFEFERALYGKLQETSNSSLTTVKSSYQNRAHQSLRATGYRGSIGGSYYTTILRCSAASFADAVEWLRATNPWVQPGENMTALELAQHLGITFQDLISRLTTQGVVQDG